MFKQLITGATRLFSTCGTFGEVDLVASSRGVVLSVMSRNYDTTGRLHEDGALAGLSVAEARRLSRLLDEAIAVAEDCVVDQPDFWSDPTIQHMAPGRVAR